MRLWFICALVLGTGIAEAFALDPKVYAVDVRAQASSSPARIDFSWPYADYARQYTIRRKSLDDSGWSTTLAVLPGSATSFSDSNLSVGSAFEYEFEMATSFYPYPGGDSSQWVNAYTYVYAGVEAPLIDYKGKVVLIVDDTMSGGLSGELATFKQDLIGAGWNVIRRDVSRNGSVNDVKNVIRAEYNADPGNVRSVVLIGHVPVPYSGAINPDLHASHKGAWPADVFYGEMDGYWSDDTVSITSGDSPDNNNYPGDGKFDQSQIPSAVELEVGRIDFWSLPSFQGRSEIDLLRNYLRKDHNFRHRVFTLPRRGLIHDNFGDLDGDAPAVDAWRHYGIFFGPGNVQEIGPDQFFPTLNGNGYLWAYGCGGGGNDKADGVGSTADFAASDPQAAFLILHGSYFGDWNHNDNFLRAGIASPNYTLASIWSGLPHWFMHHMGLGRTVGYSTRATQNNVNLYKSHENFAAQQVHIALMGDPTLEMFPVRPPSSLSGQASGGAVNLSWPGSGDENIVGYNVYYSQNSDGPYQKIGTVSSPGFAHSVGAGTHYYMVRAIKLERTGSGTFYNGSQGIFTSVTKTSGGGELPVVSIVAEDNDASEAGTGTGTFKLSRNVVDGSALTIDFSVGGSAVAGSDYSSIPQSINIPAWVGAAWLTITPYVDSEVEGDETVVITIKNSSTYSVGNSSSATVVIHDSPPPNQRPSISSIPDQTVAAGSSTGEIAFSISDAETPAGNLQVRAGSSDEGVIPISNIIFGGANGNRTIRISAPPNITGTASITVVVSDGSLEATESFNVTVVPANKPPVATGQTLTVLEDGQVGVTLGGSDPEGAALGFAISANPTKGSLTGVAPNLIYAPFKGVTGVDSFAFVVSDGSLQSTAAIVNITITPINHAPTAFSLTTNVVEEGSVKIVLRGSDPDGDPVTFLVVTNPVKGVLTGVAPNLTYTPFADQAGVDSFWYEASDGDLESPPVSVTINISGINDPPTISAIPDQVIRKNSGTGLLPFTIGDVDDSVGSLRITSATDNGTIVPTNRIAVSGSGVSRFVSVTPNTGSTGVVQITLTVSDGKSNRRTSFEVTITNSPPVAGNDLLSIGGSSLEISTATLLQNDSDADGDSIAVVGVSGKSTANGSVMQVGNLIHYASPGGFSGMDSFSYTIADSSGATAIGMVAIQVTGPRVTTIQHQQDGSILLNFVGPANRSCQVLASEDTRTWSVVGSATSGDSGAGQFVDRPALTNRFRLYRVEWP